MDLKQLLEKRAEVFAALRETREAISEAGDEALAELREKWDRLNGEYDDLGEKIEQVKAQQRQAAELDARLAEIEQQQAQRDEGPRPTVENRAATQGQPDTPDYRMAFTGYLQRGYSGLTSAEQRALQVDVDEQAGYLVAPEQFVSELIQAVDNMVAVRGLATVYPLASAESLGAPALATDIADTAWTGEITSAGEDSSLAFGKRELTPHPMSKLIKVSRPLLRKARLNVEQIVRDRMAYKVAVVQENAFLNGTGANQPLGVFTASNDGIGTAQDVSTGNTTTAIKGDGLIECVYKLKPQYLSNARWMFHRDALKQIRKIKDGNGQYLWQAGIAGNRPDTILDIPYIGSEYVPNTFTTGLYVGILGDFSNYWIAESLSMQVQRLEELYAATNQVGFIVRAETDGMPVLAEAFARVKLA